MATIKLVNLSPANVKTITTMIENGEFKNINQAGNALIMSSAYNAKRREQSFNECNKVKLRNDSLTRTVESQQLVIERLTADSDIEEATEI